MRNEKYNTLTEVISAMIENGATPIKAIAAEIGKPYSTLKRELNPDDDMAKLGADVLLGIMRSCGSVAPLEWLAERLGYVLRPANWSEPDKPTWAEEHAQDSGKMGLMASLMERGAHPAEVERQAVLLKDEIDQTATRYRRQYEQGEIRHD